MNHFNYREGSLYAENVAVSAIAARHGTPCYVYSRAALEEAFMEYRRALEGARSLLQFGERSAAPFLAAARKHLEESPFLRIDYLELVDAETLQPVSPIKRPAVLATAVFYGDVRLIDHVTLLP